MAPHPVTRRLALKASSLWATSALAGLSCLAPARAQAFPSKPVRLVVGAPPGGPSDFLARLMAEASTPHFGQSIVVENRAGASGTLATEAVARGAADGHTVLVGGPGSMVVAPYIFPKLGYDPVKDFAPVSVLGAGAFVLAVPASLPARNVQELIALAKAKPRTLMYGSGGNGSSGHLCTESLALATGTRMVHVPYKGDGQAMNDMLGGQIHFMLTAPNVAIPHAKAGRLRILAVSSKDRLAALPDVPTLHESGVPDFEYLGWIITFVPAGTPKPAIEALQAAWNKARVQPNVRGKLDDLGMSAPERLANPAALEGFMASERARVARVVKEAGIKVE